MDLSLSFSVSSVESKEYEASEVEGDLEMVEAYQFEPEVSDHSPGEQFEDTAESGDDDSGDKERLHSKRRKGSGDIGTDSWFSACKLSNRVIICIEACAAT